MSIRPIIDAGPGLNFLSTNRERLLIGILGPLSAPETVQREVLRKARQDPRFRPAERTWQRLTPKWLEILPDDVTPELAAVVRRITGLPLEERLRRPRDLGETMVVAHAVVIAEAGESVTILMDDGPGARIATSEKDRLTRMRTRGDQVGALSLVNTLTVLEKAAGGQHIPDRGTMREIYQRLRRLDDGLPPISATRLLSTALWSRPG